MALRDVHKSCEDLGGMKNCCVPLSSVRAEIVQLRASGAKWREIGRRYPGVAFGTLARIAYDESYDPVDPDLRFRLGLSEKRKMVRIKAEFCNRCNQVHPQKKTCGSSTSRRPSRNWRGLALLLAGVIVNSEWPNGR